MKSDISQFLEELGYTRDQIHSVLKVIQSLRKNQQIRERSIFKNSIQKGTPIFSLYPDQIVASGKPSIKILDRFISKYFPNIPVYILPCWESIGDGGFSIKDFTKPRKEIGTNKDLKEFCKKRLVCLDMVYSNVSIESDYVRKQLKSPYGTENNMVAEFSHTKPNSVPKSHRGHTAAKNINTVNGERWLWTTFSPHQVNLNYSSPQTLIWLLKTLAFYLDTGASSIRLDAVPFTWTKESGPVLNAPECHILVKVIRNFIDFYKPGTFLIAQADWSSKPLHDYIGNENKEAHVLYRHEIAPILIHAIISKQKTYLQNWIADLANDYDQDWISFLSSCDGIFLRPWNYPLPVEAVQLLVDACREGGGVVQKYHWAYYPPATLCTTTYSILHYRANEMNTIKRLILAHAMLLALPGIPMLFFNSVFGMKNWKKWSTMEDEARSIVREKYPESLINTLMSNNNSAQNKLYKAIKPIIDIRISHDAITQHSHVTIISDVPESIIAWSLNHNNKVVDCYFNLSDKILTLSMVGAARSLVGDRVDHGKVKLLPWSYCWVDKS